VAIGRCGARQGVLAGDVEGLLMLDLLRWDVVD